MIQAHALALQTPRNTIIYALEGHDLSRLANKRPAFIQMGKKIELLHRKRNVIRKTITHPKFPEMFKNASQKHSSLVTSRENRGRGPMRFVNTKGLAGPCGYLFLPKQIKFYNQRKRYALVIDDEDMTRPLYEMMTLLHDLLDHADNVENFDFSAYIKALALGMKKKWVPKTTQSNAAK
jgi:hypothetical protein